MASRSIDMQCWKCGTELKNLLLPFSRYEECSSCKVDLHVCIACKSHDPTVSDACKEDRADFVLDKDKANFCDYFRANPRPYQKQDDSDARQAKAKLAELFGEQTIDDGTQSEPSTPQAEADKALTELKRLFGDDD
ncbi:MAG TPA: hypothetical protein DCM64_02250 [Gammaproteobacteria bacterium]|jgi:hypothetical protein|nr:hypothetical protein [Gammaproteobacteria bacterium]MDP6732651.1 hypothetical protein [Gammaproteobacteria bacterium]HAJ75254.1 hypothetical protein [Gammaproteobacteria bacterium]|tara:strand:- start:521 stop:928 length:408 start_codon:yes stop_codon:yes gene_type:complete